MDSFKIEKIAVNQIRIVNSRDRQKKKYDEIKNSIINLGLKTPILVAPRELSDGLKYDLICGEGRLNIYIKAKEEFIPARVLECDRKSVLLMGLVENIARKQSNATVLVKEVKRLNSEGFKYQEIANKLAMSESYIGEIISLLERGEEKLLNSVLIGKMPLTIAIKITSCNTPKEEQEIISQAYNLKEIKPKEIKYLKALLEKRRNKNKNNNADLKNPQKVRSDIISRLKQDIENKNKFIERANLCEHRIRIIRTAFKKFIEDEGFVYLLKSEKIENAPSILFEK